MSQGYAQRLSKYANKGVCGLPESHESVRSLSLKLDKLVSLIRSSRRIVVLTGAGVSTAAGVPDFRGPNGIWTLEEKEKAREKRRKKQTLPERPGKKRRQKKRSRGEDTKGNGDGGDDVEVKGERDGKDGNEVEGHDYDGGRWQCQQQQKLQHSEEREDRKCGESLCTSLSNVVSVHSQTSLELPIASSSRKRNETSSFGFPATKTPKSVNEENADEGDNDGACFANDCTGPAPCPASMEEGTFDGPLNSTNVITATNANVVTESKGEGIAAKKNRNTFESASPTYTHRALTYLFTRNSEIDRGGDNNCPLDDGGDAQDASSSMSSLSHGNFSYLITQNVDGLHRRSGMPRTKHAALHGCVFTEVCAECGTEHFRDFDVGGLSFRPTGRTCDAKRCRTGVSSANGADGYEAAVACGGELRDTLLDWEDDLPAADWERAQIECSCADLILCLGTSLRIEPAGGLCETGVGGRYVIVNLQPTPYDDRATLSVRGRVDCVMRGVMEQLRYGGDEKHWDDIPIQIGVENGTKEGMGMSIKVPTDDCRN